MRATEPTAKVYFLNYVALMVLLALTATLSRFPPGAWKTPVALLIAAAKLTLVFVFFMQLWYQRGLVRIFAATGFFWLAIIGTLTFVDYLSRGWLQ
ncbi:MAG TPA: cytochrome C oxidase subunit IV family protein [Opitutaceae bacterium]|nr:cytochrome C oxidase subunit IV family protein [Opitutaceae bacterium]